MKILYVTEAMGGGVFTYIVEMANILCKECEVYIAYNTRPQTPANYKEYFDKNVHLIQIKNFCRTINPLKDILAGKELHQIAMQIKPDIIHLHSSKAGIIGRFIFAFNKAKLFYTPHGYSFLMQNYSKTTRLIFRSLEKLFAIKKCKTISCSLGEHMESVKLTANATYVNNGININEMSALCNKIAPAEHKRFTLFTLGRICQQKNPILFNEIAIRCPDFDFIWVGDGELKNLLTAPNIKITGWCNREKALGYGAVADAFILTSLWEGLPMSLIEAMYMKKVCIVSDVIGNRDVIHNGKNGYVCKSVGEFVNTIYNIAKTNNAKIVAEAYQEILDEYNVERMAQKYMEIYRE